MANPVNTIQTLDPDVIGNLVINGDLKRLSAPQKIAFYTYKCQQAGLDPAAKPFDLLTLNGKEILYANAGCTQQLTANRKLSHQITNRELVDGIYCVFCKVTDAEGRSTENMGAVTVEGLKGENKANAMLKATTKAIRRSVLAHCGLGVMDEQEVETIPGAKTEVWTAHENAVEWSEEEYAEAKGIVLAFGDYLDKKGMEFDEIETTLQPPRSTIGDERGLDNWKNRFQEYTKRVAKKHGFTDEVK
jgi:hypothetical protein